MANLKFARAVEPGNTDLERRFKAAQDTRKLGLPTVRSELGLELATNPFLRCGAKAQQASLEDQGKLQGNSTVEVFTAVRGWKDHF
jgi:hydroxyacylglutathione hydrolase